MRLLNKRPSTSLRSVAATRRPKEARCRETFGVKNCMREIGDCSLFVYITEFCEKFFCVGMAKRLLSSITHYFLRLWVLWAVFARNGVKKNLIGYQIIPQSVTITFDDKLKCADSEADI